jgi:DNA-binding transcriptional MerR regulator
VSDVGEVASGRRANKRAAVFRTIGEVAEDLDLPAHVLRFWESKFPQLKPLKRGGGRRYYRPEDIALLARIRQYLYQEGYTIRGVQKLLSEGTLGAAAVAEAAPSLFPLDPAPASPPVPAPRARAPRAARRASPPPAIVEPEPGAAPPGVRPQGLTDAQRETLEAAVQDLLSARQLLGAQMGRRKG